MLSYLRYYPLPLLLLLLVAFTEKVIFALFHSEHFNELSLSDIGYAIIWGFRFDLAISAAFAFFAILAAYLAHRLLRRSFIGPLQWSSFTAAAVLLMLHGSDMLYYGEAGRHLGYELKEGINSGGDLATAALQTYTVPVLLQLLLLFPLYWFNRRLFRFVAQRAEQRPPHPGGWSRLLGAEFALLIMLLLSAVMVRGGLGSVPLEPLHAQQIGDTQRAALALNGAYNAIFSSVTPYAIKPLFAQPPGEDTLSTVRQMLSPSPAATTSPAQPLNIVMVLLESWSGAYMSSYGYDKETTPNFDALRRRSLSTFGMLAGGHRTTEGMFATLCSWQNPLGQTVAQSQLQNYDYDCLPKMLREDGYSTAFFQGTLKNTSGTGAFARLLGFAESYGKKDVERTRYPHNSWGLHDPDIYNFALNKLTQLPEPFFIGINTNTTHAPELPPQVRPHFSDDSTLTPYLNTLHFADAALGDFIKALEKTPAFDNTVIVVVADHAGPGPASNMKKYLIPFLIYAPAHLKPHTLEVMSSQRDIAPTLLQLLGRRERPAYSGTSLLAKGERYYADYYHQGILGWVEGQQGVEFPLGNSSALNCYSLQNSPLQQRSHSCSDDDGKRRDRALAFTHLSQSLLFNGKTRQLPTAPE